MDTALCGVITSWWDLQDPKMTLWFSMQKGAHCLAQEAGWPLTSGPTLPTEQCPAGHRDLFPTVA